MPRVLNVERLENKFAALTRAKESIMNLSTWIMHHSEFCDGIVEEWLSGLSKNFSALNMFYVANDVIINCGKKRVPQYRIAFSEALKVAVGLPNVKQISKDVIRILDIWSSRGIYDEDFCETLKNKLTITETKDIFMIKPEDESNSEEDQELESDIIAAYKKENLFDKLIKLKHITEVVREKEEILKYAEEPEKPNFSFLGFQECQHVLRKVERYCDTMKGFLKLAEDEIETRKKVLKQLKNTTTFYTSQKEDVKKVAHAYKIYGKKIKLVMKNLSERKETLPSVQKDSPIFSDNDISSPKSPNDTYSSMDDSSNLDRSMPNTPHSPNNMNLASEQDLALGASFFSKLSQNLAEVEKIFQTDKEEQNSPLKKSIESSVINKSVEFRVECSKSAISVVTPDNKSPSDCKLRLVESETNVKDDSPKSSTVFKNISRTLSSETSVCDDSKKDQTVTLKSGNTTPLSMDTSSHQSPLVKSEKDIQENCSAFDHSKDNFTIKTSNIQVSTLSTEQKEIGVKVDGDLNADQVLEKSNKRESIKRKIELLLKTRGKKPCQSLDKQQDSKDNQAKIENLNIEDPISKAIDKTKLSNSIQHVKLPLDIKNVNEEQTAKYNSSDFIKENNTSASMIETKKDTNIDAQCVEQSTDNLMDIDLSNTGITDNSLPLLSDDSLAENSSFVKNINASKILEEVTLERTVSNALEVDDNNIMFPDPNDRQILTNKSSKESLKDDRCDNNFEISAKTFLSISTDLLKTILEQNKESTPQDNHQSYLKNSSQTCHKAPLNVEHRDSFFTSICSSSKYSGIPGLEISEPKKEDNTLSLSSSVDEEKYETDGPSEKDLSLLVERQMSEVKSEKEGSSSAEEYSKRKSPPINSDISSSVVDSLSDVNPTDTIVSSTMGNTEENVNLEVDSMSNQYDLRIDNALESVNCKANNSVIVNNKMENKPKNMIQTLHSVLECLSRYKASQIHRDPLLLPYSGQTSRLPTCVPLENCLRLYGALQCKSTTSKIANGNNSIFHEVAETNLNTKNYFHDLQSQSSVSDFCVTTNVLQGPILSTFDSSTTSDKKKDIAPFRTNANRDNLEVADMDCDSE